MRWTGKTSYLCLFSTEASNIEKMYQLLARRIQEILVKTCTSAPVIHLQRWWWISSVQPTTSVLFSIFCDQLGKMNEIDTESRQNTASVVLSPRISDTVTLSRLLAANIYSSCASLAEVNLSARASLLRVLGMQTAKDRRQSETSGHFRINKQHRQLSKRKTNKGLVRL